MAKSQKMTVVAFALPRDRAATREAVTLGSLPGVWVPGQAHLASEFELTDDQVRDAIDAGAPLVEVEIETKADNMDDLRKQLAKARVDEVTVTEGGEAEVEGTKLAEELMEPAAADDEGKK